MPVFESAGGVIVNPDGDVAVCSQNGNSWSLPKGHLDQGEDALTAARREIREETGLADIEFVRELGTYERRRIGKDGAGEDEESPLKRITMFLFMAPSTAPLSPEDPDNPEARWVPMDQVGDLLTHPKDREFFSKVREELGL